MADSPSWLEDWFFSAIEAERSRSSADPGMPAYAWDVHGAPRKLEGHDWPISYALAARTKRYPVLINLDEMRRNVQLALKGTPDMRTPSQRSHDAWLAYQAAKEKYERNDRGGAVTGRLSVRGVTGAQAGTEGPRARGEGGSPRAAREAPEGPQGGSGDGQEPEAQRQAEGPTPSP